jgi:hypothetical protein
MLGLVVYLSGRIALLSESPIHIYPRRAPAQPVVFDRKELSQILTIYGHHVAAGEWRDYAIDFGLERAEFSVYRRTSEMPLYRIVKDPKLALKQGAYSVVAQGGRIMKRGHELAQVLKVLALTPKLESI